VVTLASAGEEVTLPCPRRVRLVGMTTKGPPPPPTLSPEGVRLVGMTNAPPPPTSGSGGHQAVSLRTKGTAQWRSPSAPCGSPPLWGERRRGAPSSTRAPLPLVEARRWRLVTLATLQRAKLVALHVTPSYRGSDKVESSAFLAYPRACFARRRRQHQPPTGELAAR
jgi:hypothetical protein